MSNSWKLIIGNTEIEESKRNIYTSYLAICILSIVSIIVGYVALSTGNSILTVICSIFCILFYALLIFMGARILKSNNRTLWWLLLVGWFSPLWLKAKN